MSQSNRLRFAPACSQNLFRSVAFVRIFLFLMHISPGDDAVKLVSLRAVQRSSSPPRPPRLRQCARTGPSPRARAPAIRAGARTGLCDQPASACVYAGILILTKKFYPKYSIFFESKILTWIVGHEKKSKFESTARLCKLTPFYANSHIQIPLVC